MSNIAHIRPLTGRRAITLELPEFLLRTLEARVAAANADSHTDDDHVTVEHLVELELAESVSIAEVAMLEAQVPGITKAVSSWLLDME